MLRSCVLFLCFITACSFRQVLRVAFRNGQPTSICRSSLHYNERSRACLQAKNLTIIPPSSDTDKVENKAMLFLKKIGKVGGSANRDFRFAFGFDEGQGEKTLETELKTKQHNQEIKKSSYTLESCVESGIVDNMTEEFPRTSSGSRWDGLMDSIGGIYVGSLAREFYAGRISNVLRGNVMRENHVGFIQMVTNLAKWDNDTDSPSSVDASRYDGIEIDVHNGLETFGTFDMHLKTATCSERCSSYKASFCAPSREWKIVRVPFSSFQGYGTAVHFPFDKTMLTRIGIAASGKSFIVDLAVSSIRFY